MFHGKQKITQSADSLVTDSPDKMQNAMPVEFLNSITVSGLPLSHLALKVGSVKTSSTMSRSEVKDILIVGIYQNRGETESLCRPDLYSSIGVNSLYLWLGVELLIYT